MPGPRTSSADLSAGPVRKMPPWGVDLGATTKVLRRPHRDLARVPVHDGGRPEPRLCPNRGTKVHDQPMNTRTIAVAALVIAVILLLVLVL